MINYIKQNHLSLLIVLWLVVSSVTSSSNIFGGFAYKEAGKDVINITNPTHFADQTTLDKGLLVTASTTQVIKLKVGLNTTGTTINGVSTGTCYVSASAQTIAGNAAQLFDCQGTAASGVTGINTATSSLPGVTANDHCSLTFSTTTALGLSTTSATVVNTTPLWVAAASASTTGTGSGTIQGLAYNSSSSPQRWAIGSNASGTAEYICTR